MWYLRQMGAGIKRFNELCRLWTEEHGARVTVLTSPVMHNSGKIFDDCIGKPLVRETDSKVEVVYEEMPGWQTSLCDCKTYEDLPENARRYIERIEELLGIPVSVVSVGADRDGTILRKADFFQ